MRDGSSSLPPQITNNDPQQSEKFGSFECKFLSGLFNRWTSVRHGGWQDAIRLAR